MELFKLFVSRQRSVMILRSHRERHSVMPSRITWRRCWCTAIEARCKGATIATTRAKNFALGELRVGAEGKKLLDPDLDLDCVRPCQAPFLLL